MFIDHEHAKRPPLVLLTRRDGMVSLDWPGKLERRENNAARMVAQQLNGMRGYYQAAHSECMFAFSSEPSIEVGRGVRKAGVSRLSPCVYYSTYSSMAWDAFEDDDLQR